jgi:ribosomal RNA-processing protein 8
MFAVPGWNVAAQVKTQVEAPKPKDPSKPGKKASKRKEKQEERQVNAENLAEHWDKVANGNGAEAKNTQKPEANGVEATGDAAQEKRGKKRKRGKAGGGKNKEAEVDSKATGANATAAETTKADAKTPATEKPTTTTTADADRPDKKKRKKESKADKLLKANGTDSTSTKPSVDPTAVDLLPEPKGLTSLQRSMRSKLASARFRHLNESLYTKPSADSVALFKQDPSMFEDYHRGFAQQVEVWPENPVDGYVHSITVRAKLRPKHDKSRVSKPGLRRGPGHEEEETAGPDPPRGDAKPLPRHMDGHSTIADLGCGTASLSYRLQSSLKPLNLTFYSFDLSKPSGPSHDLVTIADISTLPLSEGSVDVAIFCLALMGTNWLDFIDEAYRILRWKGELWVSEIKSRFGRVDGKKSGGGKGGVPINSIGSLKKPLPDRKAMLKAKKDANKPPGDGPVNSDDELELAVVVDGKESTSGTDVSAFVEVLRKRGFVLDALPERPGDAIDLSNKMFVKMQFVKAAHPSKGKNAKEDQRAGAVAQRGGGMKYGLKGKRYEAAKEEDNKGGEDGKVLKPCLYKIR